jgi:predicted MPP superfamily phosphohydrolase
MRNAHDVRRGIAMRALSRRGVLRAALGLGLAGAAGGGYALGLEPGWVEIRPVTLRLPRLDAAFHGYRIAQLSDLHLGDWLDRRRLIEIVGLTNRQRPDLIAITGDFVTRRPDLVASDLVAALAALRAPDGVAAVLGNHDHWSDPELLRRAIRAGGAVELPNRTLTLERGRARLHVAGVDDVWEGQARLTDVLATLPAEGAAILLAHEPDYADVSAAAGRFDLQLSGHSHGGQVIVPLIGPPVLPPLARKYPVGLYRVGTMLQYTNRGVGMVPAQSRYLGRLRPFVRFNCRPEITLLTLEATR